ncbi:MAG: YciI family protein [Pseudomonadota bacterium]
MKYIVLFEDAANADPNIRKTHLKAHLGFLEERGIEAAGPLADPKGAGRDGLWIVEARNVDTVEALVREDPFWPTGLRACYTIIPWKQVFANGRRLIEPN